MDVQGIPKTHLQAIWIGTPCLCTYVTVLPSYSSFSDLVFFIKNYWLFLNGFILCNKRHTAKKEKKEE